MDNFKKSFTSVEKEKIIEDEAQKNYLSLANYVEPNIRYKPEEFDENRKADSYKVIMSLLSNTEECKKKIYCNIRWDWDNCIHEETKLRDFTNEIYKYQLGNSKEVNEYYMNKYIDRLFNLATEEIYKRFQKESKRLSLEANL